MKHILLFFLTLFFLWAIPSISTAQNPFTSKPEKAHKIITVPIKGQLFIKITFWQHQLREKMAELIRQAKSEKKPGPILLLALFAFLYGAIHSAGPGHGKAISLSYILSCKPGLLQSIVFGNIVAITHGFSGIALVLSVKFVLQASITQSLETMTYVTQIISFSLVGLMGLIIVIKSLLSWFEKPSDNGGKYTWINSNPYLTAFAVGLIPCPGVVMVMLFSISMNLTVLGIFLGASIAAGMASTITLIVLMGISGKAMSLKCIPSEGRLQKIVLNSFETLAGVLVAFLGITLLLANL